MRVLPAGVVYQAARHIYACMGLKPGPHEVLLLGSGAGQEGSGQQGLMTLDSMGRN